MSTTEPIRYPDEVKNIINHLLKKQELRNCCMVSLGLYSALRISDMLCMKWKDIFDFKEGKFKHHISLIERKTKKQKKLVLNDEAIRLFKLYMGTIDDLSGETYLFRSQKGKNKPISREQAYRITKIASKEAGLTGNISCHSLRKTFGYHAWKQGAQPAILMEIFNHSSFEVTKKYLCISQDDLDDVYKKIKFYNSDKLT